ncbi:segmentation protein cap'n'collar isoform X2 [Scaptodrosophila lebanonensis]|nr:segmentation protein cap'n'collar isoform X2 [Scaptodrosophila lebanonensis]
MPPLNRMERLQDIATFLAPIPSMEMPPYPHYPSYSYQGPGAAMPPTQQYGHGVAPPPHHGHHAAMLHATNSALGDICSAAGAPQPHYGHNLGSAVSSSMHLTNSSHDADGAASAAAGNPYKMEHDMMYYSNASSDMNHTTDGFINSFLNDEDLHLMDMNESFCRIVDNSTSNNSSVLGLPSGATSGHGSHSSGGAGSLVPGASGNHAAVGASAGLPMSGAAGGAAVGMTADLLPSGGGGAQAGADRLDASSDSAVSSMGSERVPSLSDGEWGEGSDSAQDYHHGKYGGPYDFSYNNTTRISAATRQPPVAQKKHQLYGKRDPHKQLPSAMPTAAPPPGATAPPLPPTAQASAVQCQAQAQVQSIKYEYDAGYAGMASGPVPLQLSSSEPGAMGPSLSKDYPHHQGYGMGGAYSVDYTVRPPRTPQEIVTHNHTYSLPQGTGSQPRPQARDKKTPHGGAATKHTSSKAGGSSASSLSEEEHLTRDEKRARALNIPIPVSDIINLPMDEFNERLSKYDLSENQLSLIRDIRRRGKNKVAAQNCRKRKLDQILTLEDEVNRVVKRKAHLTQEHDSLDAERKRISNKFACLHRHVFQYLRDPEGNPCSPTDYSLQQAADGSVYLLPRDKSDSNSTGTTASSAVASSGSSNLNGHAHNGIARTQASLHNHLAPAPQLHQASPHVAAMSQQQQLQLQQQQQLHQQQQQQLQQQQQAQNQQQPQHPHHTTQHKE